MNIKKNKIMPILFISLFLIFSIVTIGNKTIIDPNSIQVNKIIGANFTINNSLVSLNRVTYASNYARFNNISFNITNTDNNGVNITIIELDDNPDVGNTSISFYADCSGGTAWFNLSGYINSNQYNITKDSVFVETVTVAGGILSFNNSIWSNPLFDILLAAEITVPTITTNVSTGVEELNATLHGYLVSDGDDPNGVTAWFEYGLTNSYGSETGKTGKYLDEWALPSDFPWGVTTDGTYFYIVDAGDDEVDVFDMDLNYLSSWAITDAINPYGITTDGNYIWISTIDDDRVYRFTMAGVYDNFNFDVDSDGFVTVDITYYDNSIWCLDAFGQKIYQYTLAGVIESEFVVTHADPGGIVLKDPYIWITDATTDRVYRHYQDGTYTGISFDVGADGLNFASGAVLYEDEIYITDRINEDLYKFRINVIPGETLSWNVKNFSAGTLYHYRARVNNSNGTAYGSDMAFLTKPNVTASSSVAQVTTSSLNISWTKGDGANNTYIERNSSGITSWSRGSGIEIYNDTDSYFVDTSLVNETTYYYQAWSYTNWTYNPTVFQWSDTYSSSNSLLIGDPEITTNAATSVEATAATLQGSVVTDGLDPNDCTVWFEYGTTTGYGTNTSDQTKSTGDSFNSATGVLTAGTLYHYRAIGNNSISTAYGANTIFLSRPSVPTSFTANRAGGNITLGWTAGTGANRTYVERDTSPTWVIGSGTTVYNNTGASHLDTGLAEGTPYYYQAWGYTVWIDGGITYYQYSSSYATAGETTNNKPIFTNLIPVDNGTIDIGLFPEGVNLSIDINDQDGDTFNWTIETSPDIGDNSTDGDTNGTKTCIIVPLVNVTYTWFVNCTDTFGWTNESYNFTIENSDQTPPILDTLNVTAANGFNVSTLGNINLSAYDDVSAAIIVNITVNGETFNESISNPGQTATYSFNLSITGENLVIIVLTDDFGNTLTYQQIHTIYFINCTIVNERTGGVFDWTNAKTVGGMISCNVTVPEKGFRLDLYANENTSFYYIGSDADLLRFEFAYSNVTTVVIRSFTIDLLDSVSNIGLVEVETEFYEQLIYSTGTKAVVVKNVYSDCYIEAGYTKHAFGSTFSISALTIDMLYYLYTFDDGRTIFLASIEGSRTAQINLDFLDYVNVTYTFSILSDGIGIARYDNDTIIIYYLNLEEDNSRLDIEIYDGVRLVFSHTEFANPNEVTVYFNYGAINLTEDMLELRITAYDADGNPVVTTRYFSLATLSESPMIPAGVAAIIAILLGIFGFTFVSTKHVFGFFGIFALVAGLGLTAFAEQLWYIRLVQVALVILLAFVILIFKEESSAVT